MAQNVFFKKGLLANLPTSYSAGTFYVTTDERAMYLDIDESTRIRLGDFIQVDAVANLPTDGASTSALYYCVAENILAKWNGTTWTQINKQPTAEEMKTLLGLGSAAYTDATAYDVAGSAAAVRTYVGDIPNDENGDPMAASVIAYINKKTDGIATSGNLEALGNRVTTAEGEIDALQEASAKHVEKVEGKSLIADTEITRLAGMSDGANKVEASETNGSIKIDGVETVVYTHPEKHTSSEISDFATAVAAVKVANAEAADTATKATQDGAGNVIASTYAKQGDLTHFIGELDTHIQNNNKAFADVATALAGKQDVIPENTYDAYGSATKALEDAKKYTDGKLTEANLDQYTTEDEVKSIVDGVIKTATSKETLDSLVELVEYIDTHSGDAINMATAIGVLEGKVETIEKKPAYEITTTQISNWDNEVGAKALAETKLDASTFTEYRNAHASDYTNNQIDDAIDADVNAAMDAEVLRADGKYEEKGVAQGIVDGLKLSETYEPIGAETRAIAAAKTETENQIKALAGEGNTSTVKKNADDIASLFEQMQWGEF